MRGKCIFRGTVGTFLVLIAACVTVNIYFPAAEVQKAADKIVEEVRPELIQPPPAAPSEPQSQSLYRNLLICVASFLVPKAEAGVDINVSTPAIRNLKASLKDRFPALRPFYKKKVLGENNQGYLEIRSTEGLNLKEKAAVNQLVQAENKDRRGLYEEIIRANNLDAKVLPEVERLFANSWREKAASSGWWVQKDGGSWEK